MSYLHSRTLRFLAYLATACVFSVALYGPRAAVMVLFSFLTSGTWLLPSWRKS